MLYRFISLAALALVPVAVSGQSAGAAEAGSASSNAANSTSVTQATPPPAPAATPVPPTYVRFIDAELLLGDRTADAYSPNLTGRISDSLRAAAEFKFFGRSFAEFEYRKWGVDHPAGPVTQPFTLASRFVPAGRFSEGDSIFNSSLYGYGHTYLATSTLIHFNDEGLPTLHSDFGIGVERLPDPTRAASLFGSYYYYPELSGKLAPFDGSRPSLRYKAETFRLGGSLAIPQTNFFLSANLVADHFLRKEYAPGNVTHTSASLGIGFHV